MAITANEVMKNGLTEEQYNKWILNKPCNMNHEADNLTVADILMSSIDWEATTEGFHYWNEIHESKAN